MRGTDTPKEREKERERETAYHTDREHYLYYWRSSGVVVASALEDVRSRMFCPQLGLVAAYFVPARWCYREVRRPSARDTSSGAGQTATGLDDRVGQG